MNRRALVLSKLLVLVPLTAVGGGAVWWGWGLPQTLEPPAPADVDLSLRSAGITPDALAASGVTGPQTTALFEDAFTHLTEALPALQAAQAALTTARQEVEDLERVVIAGLSTQEQRTALAAARTALASATASRAAALNELFAAATADLAPERVAALTTISANSAAWEQPVQYLVVERPEAERVEFREAIAAVRIATDNGEDPDQTSLNLVNTWNADGAVAAATTSLNANLAAVNAAWAQALAP